MAIENLPALAGTTPVFAYWAIRGSADLPWTWFLIYIAVLIIATTVLSSIRLRTKRRRRRQLDNASLPP